jgi:tetratricopeptide (TPR) repeat protein
MSKKIYLFISAFASLFLSAQSKEGYWDNIRTTNETISLKAGEKIAFKTQNFPTGTTEVVYRITLLDENQQMANSLVSLLKAIPDPSGVSQGSAGALFLVSKIAGDDKCKFSIYTNASDAENFAKSGKTINACYAQNTAVNKDAKLLTANSGCITSKTTNLWFGFESDNMIFKEKIVVEVVPWIDNKLSRGWNGETKKEILTLLEKQKVTPTLKKKDEFFALFLDEISKKYTYNEYKQFLQIERDNVIETNIEASLKKSGEVEKYYNTIRDRSYDLFKKGKTDEAIDFIITEMIAKKGANYKDYGVLGDYYLLTKQFTKAEEAYQSGLKLNPTEINFQLNLAHVYLFTDRVSEAKEIYKKYANQTLFTGKAWIEQVKNDFADFEKRGFPKQNYKKIIRMIEKSSD